MFSEASVSHSVHRVVLPLEGGGLPAGGSASRRGGLHPGGLNPQGTASGGSA